MIVTMICVSSLLSHIERTELMNCNELRSINSSTIISECAVPQTAVPKIANSRFNEIMIGGRLVAILVLAAMFTGTPLAQQARNSPAALEKPGSLDKHVEGGELVTPADYIEKLRVEQEQCPKRMLKCPSEPKI